MPAFRILENPLKLDFQTHTILIVDDDPNHLAMMVDYLEGHGFKTLVSRNGEWGSKKAQYAQPDLILLDILLPGMDGFETCRQLKSNEVTKDIPVIFMTALIKMEDKIKGLEAGAVDYVTKPFQYEEVLARVTTHLRVRDLTRELQEARAELEKRVEERTAELARTNQKLRVALKEKEILLQEIYHRTKNNMQIVSSLLNLQSMYVEDEQVLEIFRDTEERIRAMALVHQKLYQSKDLSNIDLKVYIEDLAYNLLRSYRTNPEEVFLKFDMDSVLVTIDTAIPCGLIINEIISNALKHAFPNNKKGEIRIGLHSPNRGKIEIVIADNGIGMSKDLDLRQVNSLGLQIVSNVVEKQLQGEIDLILGRGTEFRIWFREHHQSKKGLMDEKNKDNDC